MKTFTAPLLVLSSLSFIAAGCGMDVTDDVTTTDDALSCNGFHHDPAKHIGHHHHRHHHGHDQGGTGGGGAGGSRPHLTGTGGSGGSAMGGSGGSSTGGTGGVAVDPRCAMVPGIVSWWHGDGDFDDAVGSNDGTNGGAVTFGAGVENQGFDLNGASGSFVEVPDAANLEMTTALTIDAPRVFNRALGASEIQSLFWQSTNCP